MRIVPLKQRSKFSDKDVLLNILQAPAAKGLTIGEMRRQMKLVDKVEAAKDRIALEQAEYDFLVKFLSEFPFATPHRDFVALADDLGAASESEDGSR